MEIVNEIVKIGNENTDLKVIDVKILHDMNLLINFSDGSKKIFDASKLLIYPIYEKLKNNQIFNSIDVKNGIIVWDNGNIDIGIDYLYKYSENYTQD